MKTKKLLSILLALMMMLSVVPFYASAEVVALTKDNVVTWPTTSGEIWFGQKLSDGITLNSENALVTSDGTATGTVIPGTWEFIDSEFAPTAWGTSSKANIKFTPENTDAYSGFEVTKSANVTYVVNKTTPVFVDEINDPIVATDVEQGAKLSTSTVSGGQMKNPYTNEIINKTWKWSSKSTIVNSTGEYKVNFAGGSSYNKVEAMVMVKVIGTMQETEIVESPEAVTVEYSVSAKNSDLAIVGGKAVIKGTTTEVPGQFSFKAPDSAVGSVGEKTKTIVFTPDDTENYIASEGTMSVTVTKGNYKFVNENGEEIVPEITLPYGTTFNTGETLGSAIKSVIKDFSNLTGVDAVGGTGSISIVGHDADEIAPVGTKTYTARIRPYNSDKSNYNVTDLQFVLTIEPVVFTTTASWGIEGVISGKLSHTVPGTFDIFVDGKLVGDNVGGGNEWSVDYPIPATGDYTIKVVYNPVENDNYSMVDFEKTVNAKMRRYITFGDGGRISKTVNGDERMPIMKLGDTIELSTLGGEKFLGWRITDANGNAVDLGIADLMASTITFTMPDYDLIVTAEYEKENTGDTDGGFDIDNIFGNLTKGDSDCWLVNFINNLIAKIKQIITTVTSLFRSIGDHT